MVYSIVFSIIIVLFIVGSILYVKHNNKKSTEKLKLEFGAVPDAKFDARDFEDMKNYYKYLPINGDTVDDITWDDLDMDLLFKRIKNTQSSVGDEYLYRFMRHQKTECNEHFEDVVTFMQNSPNERIELQKKLKTIGRKPSTKKIYISGSGTSEKVDSISIEGISLSKFIINPDSRPRMENWKRIIAMILSIVNIACIAFGLSGFLGITSVIIIAVYGSLVLIMGAIFTYTMFKNQLATYEDLASFIELINVAKAISKNSIPALEKEINTIKKSLVKFNKVNVIESIFLTDDSIYITALNIAFWFYVHSYHRYLSLVQNNKDAAKEIFDTIGFIELCISVASYRESISNYCHPDFNSSGQLSFKNIVHPLLKSPVANSDTIGERIIITGSNASGKSTFAKTIALNTYMGQVFNMCFADSFSFKPCTVITSMSIKDDISQGDSYFVAEVKTIRRMLESLNINRYPMLFLDEIFKGTNTIERIASAAAVMEKFGKSDCFICLTTHDIELSHLLKSSYENYHFIENIEKENIVFDYKLKHGIVNGSNAIKMLQYHRIEKDIVHKAQAYADNFRKTGKWSI